MILYTYWVDICLKILKSHEKPIEKKLVVHFMLQTNGRGRTSSNFCIFWAAMQMVDAKITVMVQKSYTIWNSQKIPVKSRIKLPTWSPVAGFSELLTVSSICIYLCAQILSQLADLKGNQSIWLALDWWNMMKFIVFLGGKCWTKGHISRKPYVYQSYPESAVLTVWVRNIRSWCIMVCKIL